MPEPLDVDVTDNGLQDPRPRGTWSDWLQAFFSGITASVMVAVFAYTYVLWKENPWSQEYFDNMLEEIVTAPYNPITPEKYVTRQQHGNLSANLRTFANSGGENGFFMLVGESGSGKTTLMRTLLRNEYKEGVLELTLSATEMVIGRAKGVPFLKQIQASVYSLFGECPERSKRFPGFINFVNHANEVRKKAKKDAHQLIIYITLESKDELDFDTMKEFGKAFGSVATLLSSKTGSCKTIVEFSKPAISDHIRWYRGSDQSNFEVNAMTEDEFQDIGAQLLDVSEDKQTISVPYLEHYHNWLGGHTKTLKKLSGDAKIAIESATPDTEKEILTKLKERIDAEFEASVKQIIRQQTESSELLKAIVATGVEGFCTSDLDEKQEGIMHELTNRDSSSTLLRKVTKHDVRIHRYSHALYLHGVTGPNPNPEDEKVEQNIKDTIKVVKDKFMMNAKSANPQTLLD